MEPLPRPLSWPCPCTTTTSNSIPSSWILERWMGGVQRRPTYKVSCLRGRVPLDLTKSFVRAFSKIDPPGGPGGVFDLKCASCGRDRGCTQGCWLSIAACIRVYRISCSRDLSFWRAVLLCSSVGGTLVLDCPSYLIVLL